ncbi:DNA-3-methyladenine glycosylase [Marinobacter salicampi]|uniref:DNA-3-methyladenine glycosylase n=1 Tax=Marinobacter salicampi TaxID=435907 RepID=UPI00140BEBAB|nr:DNA-3-methyladenine glycosylase [Marinobacter salicampi]
MSRDPLSQGFYARPSALVARELIGTNLVRELDGERLVGRIIETEAYGGASDTASHASRGKTPRNDPMFGPAGFAYIYLIYGLYDLLNVVTETDSVPGAVLIRAFYPVSGEASMSALRGGKAYPQLANGPGKLTRAMGITRVEFNRHDLCLGESLWIEQGEPFSLEDLLVGPRVGIDYARPVDRDAPLRFRLALPRRSV